MKIQLLRSFIIVLSFWWFLLLILWISGDSNNALNSLNSLLSLIPFMDSHQNQSTEFINMVEVRFKVLSIWSAPILILAFISFGVGYGLKWFKAVNQEKERKARIKGNGQYRGIGITLGILPAPRQVNLESIELESEESPFPEDVSKEEIRVIEDIIGTMVAHPGCYSPEPSKSLPDVALGLLEKGLQDERMPGLLAIVLTANELGNLTAYKKKDNGSFEKTKPVEKESARILVKMHSWWELGREDRNAVYLAVKYRNSIKDIPELFGIPEIAQKATYLAKAAKSLTKQKEAGSTQQAVTEKTTEKELLSENKNDSKIVTSVAPEVSVEENPFVPVKPSSEETLKPKTDKADVFPEKSKKEMQPPVPVFTDEDEDEEDESSRPKKPKEEILWSTLLTHLPSVSFHSKGAQPGAPKLGHKFGNRIYLMEIKFREFMYSKLPEHLKAEYPTGQWKVKGKPHPLSQEYLRLLDSRKMLVKEINGETVDTDEALWKIKAGSLEFKGVIIFDADSTLLEALPNGDSSYEVEVTGPLFKSGPVSSNDISSLKDAMSDILSAPKNK